MYIYIYIYIYSYLCMYICICGTRPYADSGTPALSLCRSSSVNALLLPFPGLKSWGLRTGIYSASRIHGTPPKDLRFAWSYAIICWTASRSAVNTSKIVPRRVWGHILKPCFTNVFSGHLFVTHYMWCDLHGVPHTSGTRCDLNCV